MFNKKLGLLASTALVASIASSVAFSGAATAQIIDEIIVTATKRETTLQETPITVSVTSADVLKKAQILDITDLQSVVPSLRVGQLQTSTNTNFRIRGFGNGANNAGIEPSVGVFIDGVYRSRSAAQIGDLTELERIEVLSGPQSTLFGKNASAGVISVITAKPSFQTQGYLEGGFGNYNQRVFRGYVTGGLSDTIALSFGGTVNRRDGYAVSAVADQPASNDRDRFSIRGQFLFEPRDDISIRFIVDHSEIDEFCCHVTNTVNGETAPAIVALGGALADPNNPFAYINYQDQTTQNAVNDDGISAHIDVDFDTFSFTSITAYRSNKSDYANDADFTTADMLIVDHDVDIKTFTQEIRLTSTGDNMIDWMLGVYYFTEDITQLSGLDVGSAFAPYANILAGGNLTTLEGLFGQAAGTFFNANNDTFETFTQDDEAYSVFASVDFHATEQLTVTGGVNFTKDKKTVTGNTINNEVYSNIDLNNDLTVYGVPLPTVLFGQTFTASTGLEPTSANIAFIEGIAPGTTAAINAGVAAAVSGLQSLQFLPQFLGFGNSVEDGKSDDEQVTWTARLAYEVNSNFNVYASAATGFKSTSWNLSRDSRPDLTGRVLPDGTPQTSLDNIFIDESLAQPNQTYGTRFANPEDAMVYEVGVKARFDKGAFNIALFDQSIDGFQANTFIGTGFVLSNAGKQRTKGVEFDASYYPTDSLALTFAGIYLDAVYDSFVNAPGPDGTIVDLSGQKVAGVPEFGFSTSATYTHDFGGGTTGYIRGDYQYESTVDIVEILGIEAKSSYVNGSLGLKLDNGFGVQVWGRNIFGHETYISAFPGVVQAGTINAYPVAPATYGVLLRKEF